MKKLILIVLLTLIGLGAFAKQDPGANPLLGNKSPTVLPEIAPQSSAELNNRGNMIIGMCIGTVFGLITGYMIGFVVYGTKREKKESDKGKKPCKPAIA